jgi:hypothetical protein
MNLGIILSPKISKPSICYRFFDDFFFYYPHYSSIVAIQNKITKEVAQSYHMTLIPARSNAEIIKSSQFIFVFGGDCLPAICAELALFKEKCLIVN